MRHDLSFPCMEDPPRCFITTRPLNSNGCYALSCDRRGRISLSTRRSSAEEWYLLPCSGTSSTAGGGGTVRLINKAHGLELRNLDDDLLLATTTNTSACTGQPDPTQQKKERSLHHNGIIVSEDDHCNYNPEFSEHGPDDDQNLWLVELELSAGHNYHNSAIGNTDKHHCQQERRVRIRSMATNACISTPLTATGIPEVVCNTTNDNDNNPWWSVQLLTGELCHLQLASSYAIPNQPPILIMCDHLGKLKVTSTWGGWELFRFTPVLGADYGIVRISSFTHHSRFLACTAQGHVLTTTSPNNYDDSTLWRLARVPQGVSIQNVQHARYLTYNSNSRTFLALTAYPGAASAAWRLSAGHRQCYYLSTNHNQKSCLLSMRQGQQVTTSHYRQESEVWQLHQIDHGDNIVVLQNKRWRTYLACCCQQDGQKQLGTVAALLLTDDRQGQHQQQSISHSSHDVGDDYSDCNMDRSSLWMILPCTTPGSGIFLQSVMEPGLFLACNSNGQLSLVPQPATTTWQLETVLPFSLQQWHIGLMVGGAAVGAVALLAPAVLLGTMAASSAQASGAAAAAATTAAVATAEVAAVEVAAAETVAVAAAATGSGVGMGLAGAGAAAMAAGAAMAASVTGLMVMTQQNNTTYSSEGVVVSSTMSSSSSALFPGHHRPFCEWEYHNFGGRQDDGGTVADWIDLRLEL